MLRAGRVGGDLLAGSIGEASGWRGGMLLGRNQDLQSRGQGGEEGGRRLIIAYCSSELGALAESGCGTLGRREHAETRLQRSQTATDSTLGVQQRRLAASSPRPAQHQARRGCDGCVVCVRSFTVAERAAQGMA
jgi:hypothetical protein